MSDRNHCQTYVTSLLTCTQTVRLTSLTVLTLALFLPSAVVGRQRSSSNKKRSVLTGTYVMPGRKGAGGTFLVRQLSPTSIEFSLECNRGAPSYNSGFARGTVDVMDGIASYHVTEFNGPCEIRFDFKTNSVVVSQKGDDFACGFGHGVDCSGTYRLKNHRTPKIKNPDQ